MHAIHNILNDLRVHNVTTDSLRVRGNVQIDGDLHVNGSTTTLEVNNLEKIEHLEKRLITLEHQNKKLLEIVTKLQYHPDSPYVADVAKEWNKKYSPHSLETDPNTNVIEIHSSAEI